jgi:hypothetical protein
MPLPLGELPPGLKHQCPPPLLEALKALFSSHFALKEPVKLPQGPPGMLLEGPLAPPPARKPPYVAFK